MPAARIALVLGGGGVVGAPWEAAVLTAIHDEIGWDARDASVIVGTSAGAILGACLAHGEAPSEARERYTTAATAGDPASWDSDERDWDIVRTIFAMWEAGEPDAAQRQEITRLATAASPLASDAWVAEIGGELPDSRWPDGDFRVCSVEVGTARRVVWQRGEAASLAEAVAASSAVPGIFPPVPIGGESYLDGIVLSGSHADVVAEGDGPPPTDMIFVGPMVGDAGVLRHAARALSTEVELLEARSVRCHVVVPGPEFSGIGLMNRADIGGAIELGAATGRAAARELGDALS